jgi:chorismate-pyruvate lyase
MTHEDVLGLPLKTAREILLERGVEVTQVVYTCAPKSPQQEGNLRVVALRQDGRILVAARFLDGMIQV